jgi:hypothetical protein
MFNSDVARDTGISWASDGVMNVLSNAVTVGQFNGSGFTGNAATATTAAACSGNSATATALTTASGSAPSYSARAWVNFNGTGTVAIRASGNVSSITDNGTGDYTVNFTTAMPDANYAFVPVAQQSLGDNLNSFGVRLDVAPTTSTIRIVYRNQSGTFVDPLYYGVAIFR